MSQESWKAAEREYTQLLQTLDDSSTYIVVEGAEEWEDDEKAPQPEAGKLFKIPGSIVSLIERLDDELTRSLQQTDPHTADYIERLGDEQLLYNDIVRSLIYAEKVRKMDDTNPESRQDAINRINTSPTRAYLLQADAGREDPRGKNYGPPYHRKLDCETHTSKQALRRSHTSSDSLQLSLREERRHYPSSCHVVPNLLPRLTRQTTIEHAT